MQKPLNKLKPLLSDFKRFLQELLVYLLNFLHIRFSQFESIKNLLAKKLYRQRGRMARRLMHSGMAGITAFGVMIAPIIVDQLPEESVDPWNIPVAPSVLSASTYNPSTDFSGEGVRDRVIEYTVTEGDTVSTIAEKFNISSDTIRWQNDLASKDSIKIGQELEILPVTGVSHKVIKGDTVYSIAKKYDVDPQEIVNFPFNTFMNDETFELAIGQQVIVPNGIVKTDVLWSPVARIKQTTPDAGTVVASGQFVWPSSGTITQGFSWYHKAIDIANRAAPNVLAADSGTVVTSGWTNVGYGYHVIIDHGNGYRTLYAHLSKLYVVSGQTVARGNAIGQMGSTGRSTGTHLHFEVIKSGVYLNPLSVLR